MLVIRKLDEEISLPHQLLEAWFWLYVNFAHTFSNIILIMVSPYSATTALHSWLTTPVAPIAWLISVIIDCKLRYKTIIIKRGQTGWKCIYMQHVWCIWMVGRHRHIKCNINRQERRNRQPEYPTLHKEQHKTSKRPVKYKSFFPLRVIWKTILSWNSASNPLWITKKRNTPI